MALQKKVILFGTFDIIHPGHLNLFWQAKKLGNYLIIVIARDKTVKLFKKQNPIHNEQTRIKAIKNSRIADKVILGSLANKYSAIKKYRPNIIALGYDQTFLTNGLKEELKNIGLNKTKIVRLKQYKAKKYKTSIILKNTKK